MVVFFAFFMCVYNHKKQQHSGINLRAVADYNAINSSHVYSPLILLRIMILGERQEKKTSKERS